jgi:hypothetical protein
LSNTLYLINSYYIMSTVEVFRLTKFDKDKCYEFALRTKTEGKWPNQIYYTENPLQYLGKYTHSESWGYGDGSGGAENFDDNGRKNRIVYDYEGNTCFRVKA